MITKMDDTDKIVGNNPIERAQNNVWKIELALRQIDEAFNRYVLNQPYQLGIG
jgi:hypothetical protein